MRSQILEQGWSERAGAFTQVYGSDDLDASALVIPMVEFLPYDDHRVHSTVEAIVEDLVDSNGLVYRYRTRDGFSGDEGAFLLCTFWLAEALAGMGDVTRARDIFESAVAYSNDLGLLSEEVNPDTGALMGNFPQAFSHVGLVNAAWTISQAEEAKSGSVAPVEGV